MIAFVCLLILSGLLIKYQFNFVMFPHEETRDIVISGSVNPEAKRFETAQETQKIEKLILKHFNKEMVGMRTNIARSRRGGAVEENNFRMLLEIVPKEKRKKTIRVMGGNKKRLQVRVTFSDVKVDGYRN